MGVCQSQEEKVASQKSKQIEKKMMDDHMENQKIVKLLLLGAGESGKSTVLKQMKIIHDDGFSEEECSQQRAVVYSNTVNSMATLLKAMQNMDLRFDSVERELDARVVLEVVKLGEESEPFSDQLTQALKALWADAVLQQVYVRRTEYQLNDSAFYFLDAVDRIGTKGYKPTDQDILRARVKTTGIIEVRFQLKGVDFHVFDVGGQRSERKKWIHCFEDVNAIIFIVAMSEYNQTLFEDNETNRMAESLRLFESICNSKWFTNTSMILFLNKRDLFMEKIELYPLTIAFPDYRDANEYAAASAYIEEKFEGLNENADKTIYTHQTCATDTNQVQLVLDSVTDMIIQQNLQGCGLY